MVIGGLNPINCKEWQVWGFKFSRKQNASNMLKNIAKLGAENYSYLDTINYSKKNTSKVSIILNKTRTFYESDDNVALKKRDIKRMKKANNLFLNPAKELPLHLYDSSFGTSYQTVHIHNKRFGKEELFVKSEPGAASLHVRFQGQEK